ncbi:YbjN domain-containing protein [Corynebacterium sp. 320]|uniref:YbjN domain-containing protein n=1 Tax=Corynebacterium zhongnanshanii TaxID=2768834 RepID=A0ABQ6VE44_9CORY|nr:MULTISPECIES: YbjN domain-containing protein [Corynebacterium]KAB1504433.1 YbjN domain-containing protein [Corynebacterium sp. 320]KAB1552468.1 YbjN domain-containing protein [Corynebacterium sp. 321]KAB1554317.1 YbjN domain-containing protein [Corynebacterium sp. 319]KAB3522712.1 YbjN domain-containing protein [Corynebacterium zhongnanshanii]KAB3528569.1 YbjN domain-containing protein [Corynebacterium sp. 250]
MDRQGICDLLDTAEVEYQDAGDNVVVVLPGEKRLKTNCIFIPQEGMFRVEAFVCRRVEEAQEEVYKLLLHANRKSFGVHYTLDRNDDIYLVGQFPDSTTADDVQRILGQVLERADQDFNRILERGFESSIKHEWAWRLSRGEPTFNLAAFAHLKPDEAEVALLSPPPDSDLPETAHQAADPQTGQETNKESEQ